MNIRNLVDTVAWEAWAGAPGALQAKTEHIGLDLEQEKLSGSQVSCQQVCTLPPDKGRRKVSRHSFASFGLGQSSVPLRLCDVKAYSRRGHFRTMIELLKVLSKGFVRTRDIQLSSLFILQLNGALPGSWQDS